MKKLFALGIVHFLFFCPIAVHTWEISEELSPEPILEEAKTYLLGEDIYQGNLNWQGNKAPRKFNYDKKRKERYFKINCYVLIGLAQSWYFKNGVFFNHIHGYGVIFASIPLGLKFASVAGLNPIAVIFIYLRKY